MRERKLTSRSSEHEGRHSALVGYAGYKVTGKHSHRTSFIKSHAKMVGSFLYKIPVYVFCTETHTRSVTRLAQLCCTYSYPTAALCMQHNWQTLNAPAHAVSRELSARLTVDCSAHGRLGGNGLGMHAIYIHCSSELHTLHTTQ